MDAATIDITDPWLERYRLPEKVNRARHWDSRITGFGVIVGKRRISFVVQRRVKGESTQTLQTIGHWAPPKLRAADPSLRSSTMTVSQARGAAIDELARMRGGEDPHADRDVGAVGGPSLAAACDDYLERMRGDGCSSSSIETVRREILDDERSYLKAWLSRPLASIEGGECRGRHEAMTRDNGPHVANRVMRQLRAIWNHVAKEAIAGTLTGWRKGVVFPANATIAVQWNTEKNPKLEMVDRRQEPIAWAELPAWHAAVLQLGEKRFDESERVTWPGSPIRRDYNLVVLLTGLRRMDAATIRWEHVNLTDKPITTKIWNPSKSKSSDVELPPHTLHRPNPKGGKDRAFSIPLSSTCIKILKQRKTDNINDHGWAFPADALKDKECHLCASLGLPAHVAGGRAHLAEPKEDSKILVSPHRLRDTYTSALATLDPPLSPFVVDILTNHRPPRGSVTAGYINLDIKDLARAQERVTDFLVEKMRPRRKRAA